jgi:hypothetical protein
MVWTEPAEWEVGDVLTDERLNEEIRDNLLALKDPPSALYTLTGNYTTTSTSFVDVDTTNLSLTVTPTGTKVMIMLNLLLEHDTTLGITYFDILKNGATISPGALGIAVVRHQNINVAGRYIAFTRVITVTGLTPNTSVTFKLQWKTGGTTSSIIGATALSQC